MSGASGLLGHGRTIWVSRVVIGLVFIAAGLAKVGDMATFAGDIHNFRLAPIALENLIAITLPWIELVAGLALVLGIRARAGALIAFVMMVAFTLGVGQALARGLDIECGCFGTADASSVGWVKLVQNVVLTGIAALAARVRR